jgi:hypothetical protein
VDNSDISPNDYSGFDLMGKNSTYRGQVLQSTSFEVDISQGIQDAYEESKSNNESHRDSGAGTKTYLQFKLNNGKITNAYVNLDTTTVLDLKIKVFKHDLEIGKSVKLLFMGKMLDDNALLNNYKLSNMSFVHAIISKPLIRPEGARPADGIIETTDGKLGFDRFLRLRSKQFTDLQVHQMRLSFHSIMMRSGTEKTDETADGLLENEEKWLKGVLPNDDKISLLMLKKTVLS